MEAHDHLLLGKISRYVEEQIKSLVVDELRPTTKPPSEKNKGKPSKKTLLKRQEKKDEEKKDKKVKVRHRDSKNVGKRRKPKAAQSVTPTEE